MNNSTDSALIYYIIYRITNLINKKFYIGAHQTPNINDYYFGSSKILNAAIKKHGKRNFIKDILFMCPSKETMYQLEATIVDKEFIKRKDTYNVKIGGFGGGHEQTKETRQKISKFFTGRKLTKEHIKKIIMTRKGYTHSEKTKQKISLSKKGWIVSEETKNKMKLYMKGQVVVKDKEGKCFRVKIDDPRYLNGELVGCFRGCKLTEEQKRKISIIKTGKRMSNITKEKMRLVNIGRKLSEETKKKIRDALIGKKLSLIHRNKISLSHKNRHNI